LPFDDAPCRRAIEGAFTTQNRLIDVAHLGDIEEPEEIALSEKEQTQAEQENGAHIGLCQRY